MLSMLYLCTNDIALSHVHTVHTGCRLKFKFLDGHSSLLLILVFVCVPHYCCWVWSLYVVLDIVAGCVSECNC